jgi:hypothetical protein
LSILLRKIERTQTRRFDFPELDLEGIMCGLVMKHHITNPVTLKIKLDRKVASAFVN